MGERLLNLYVYANKMKRMEVPILKISDDPEIDDMPALKYLVRSIIRDIAVKVTA